MMKKNYLLAVALALTAMVSCTDESFVGDQGLKEANESVGAISFDLNTPAVTRAEVGGAAAATALNNEFIIWGEKKETDGTAATAANQVFYNYKVNYTSNSAYTTTSNTKNWEYVGLTPYTSDKVSPAITGTQTIKYWDYDAASYTFTAVSAKPGDIADGKVKITKITSGSTAADKGYEIAVNSGASLDDIFVADRNNITKTTGTDRTATNAYGGNVTMKFRNFMSKIRFGIYEDIPGYKVNITNVDYSSNNSTSSLKFGVDGKFLAIGDGSSTNTIFTVTYDSNNKAVANLKAASTPGTSTYLETAQTVAGCPILSSSAASPISTTSATPTWDKTDGAYTTIMPYTTNDGNMKVKLDFTLTSTDTGETIIVTDATAEIPAAYCQWKSNYAYTYILKLNDNTNGQIGGVTGLYPITFDAIEITDENGEAEYITTVSNPSITTFGVTSTGAYSAGKVDYETGTDIYATIVSGGSILDPTSKYAVYTVTAGSTEAQVAEAVAEHEIRSVTPTLTYTSYTTNVSVVTSVPAEDGGTKTLTGAIKMQSPAAATYAVEYKVYDGSAEATNAEYSASATYYSITPTSKGFYQIAVPSEDDITNWTTSKSNFTTAPTQPVYVYKVIKVVDP